jgi:transposase-like protein
MFEDILAESSKKNKKIVCPGCGTTVIKIESDFESNDYEIERWEYKCKKCSGT